jgi:hypothetical protein
MTVPELPQTDPPRWTVAALALSTGATNEEAASLAGVGRKTLYRWRRHPKFQNRVQRYRDELVTASLGKLSAKLAKATDTLASLLDDDSPPVRLRAACALLDMTLKLRHDTEISTRLSAAESALERMAGKSGTDVDGH